MRKFLYVLCLFLPLVAEETPPSTPSVEETTPVTPEGDAPEFSKNLHGADFVKTVVGIFIALFAALVLVWVLRRIVQRRPLQLNQNKNIKILEKRHLSPNTYLYHIEVGDKQFILAESKFHIKTVATLDWGEPEA